MVKQCLSSRGWKLSTQEEKQPVTPQLWMQIHLSDLLVVTVMLGGVLSIAFHALHDDASIDIYFRMVACFFVSAIAMLMIAVRFSNSIKEPSPPRLGYLIGFQLIGWLFGWVATWFCVEGMSPGRRHSMPIEGAQVGIAIALAEEIYLRTDYDNDGVKEYAATIQDLFERSPGAADLNLVDFRIAGSEGLPASAPTPHAGFCCVILTAQGPHSPGGAKSYIDAAGNMTGGFGVLVYPAKYDPNAKEYARSCYLIGANALMGNLYRCDFGPKTLSIVPTITTFDPDTNWKPCE